MLLTLGESRVGRVAGWTYGITAPSCSRPSAASAAAIARSSPTSCALSTSSDAADRDGASTPRCRRTRRRDRRTRPRRRRRSVAWRRAHRGRRRRGGAGRAGPTPTRASASVTWSPSSASGVPPPTFGDQQGGVRSGDAGLRKNRGTRTSASSSEEQARTRGARLAGGGCRTRRRRARGTRAIATASRSTDRRADRDRTRPHEDGCRARSRRVDRGCPWNRARGRARRSLTSKPSWSNASRSSLIVGRPPGAPNAMCTAAPVTTPRKRRADHVGRKTGPEIHRRRRQRRRRGGSRDDGTDGRRRARVR